MHATIEGANVARLGRGMKSRASMCYARGFSSGDRWDCHRCLRTHGKTVRLCLALHYRRRCPVKTITF